MSPRRDQIGRARRCLTILFLLLVALICAVGDTAASVTERNPADGDGDERVGTGSAAVKHVVVLMFENRSFDHMLGVLKQTNPAVNGLNGTEGNYMVPNNASTPFVRVSFDADVCSGIDPNHSLGNQEIQLWGSDVEIIPAPMDGYLFNNNDTEVLRSHNSTTLPVLQYLANEYAVFDSWHCSLPGPTEPNRMYSASGTSYGTDGDPSKEQMIEGFPQRTFYNDLYDAGLDFNIYFHDFPISLLLDKVRDFPLNVLPVEDFALHASTGQLPTYSFIEPRWFSLLEYERQDQHPPYSVTPAEDLIQHVYDQLKAGPAWNESLLVITYDENGGYYDHVPPPQEGVPNPDGLNSTDFNFTRLGVRVPMVMVSPLIPPRTVVSKTSLQRQQESSPTTINGTAGLHFDHTSLMHSLRGPSFFNMSEPPLTKREAWSGVFTLSDIVTPSVAGTTDPSPERSSRTIRPCGTAGIGTSGILAEYPSLLWSNVSGTTHQNLGYKTCPGVDVDKLDDLQLSILEIALDLAIDSLDLSAIPLVGSDDKPARNDRVAEQQQKLHEEYVLAQTSSYRATLFLHHVMETYFEQRRSLEEKKRHRRAREDASAQRWREKKMEETKE